MKKLITLAFCIFYLSSCTANHGHFTVITNKMLDKSHFKIADQQVGKNVRGRSVTHIILSWELGDSDISEALDRAMKQDEIDLICEEYKNGIRPLQRGV